MQQGSKGPIIVALHHRKQPEPSLRHITSTAHSEEGGKKGEESLVVHPHNGDTYCYNVGVPPRSDMLPQKTLTGPPGQVTIIAILQPAGPCQIML